MTDGNERGDPQKNFERVISLARGPKGEQGERGQKGTQGTQGTQGVPGMSPAARRAFVFLSILMLLLAGANLLFTAQQIAGADGRTRVQCRFDADLGGAPVALAATGKPSLLAVSIVSDARIAWHQLGCPGRIGAPASSFAKWATYYHLPVS